MLPARSFSLVIVLKSLLRMRNTFGLRFIRRNPRGRYFFSNDLKSCYFEGIGLDINHSLYSTSGEIQIQRYWQDEFCSSRWQACSNTENQINTSRVGWSGRAMLYPGEHCLTTNS